MSNPVLVNQIIRASDVVPLTGRVGAEIRGIRLGGDLSDATVAAINQLLLKHKVIFFRDQEHLDDAQQESFARRLGDLVPHPTQGPVTGTASILTLDSSRGGGRADQWHTDVTSWMPILNSRSFAASSFRRLEVIRSGPTPMPHTKVCRHRSNC